ncbi:MAG TPA: glycoside hydrolase family 31 protein [Spirochaetota bacterium]|nr:glycoside hydrolase family 31 protein [Spirochaetota bacterium]
MLRKMELLNFTDLYRFGNPFKTGATLINFDDKFHENSKTPDFFEVSSADKKIILKYNLDEKDAVYGLGQSLGGINKRGKKYRLYATDDPLHTPEKESLYGSHPFLIIKGKNTFGFFIDFPGEIVLDVGFTQTNLFTVEVSRDDFDLYVFNNADVFLIIKEFLTLTGTPYVPPKWAFGFGQSRWSYPDEKTVTDIADNFRKNKIPCDMIFLDIDYMDNYKVFTVDKKKFPNFKKFVSKMKDKGFRLLPIIDPGVKIEKGYDVYEEGLKNNYFCKDEKGNNFTAAVWPGLTHFPDFTNKTTRRWWGGLYKRLTDEGIEGFWNDMNEPALFYTKEGLDDLKKTNEEVLSKEDPGFDFFKIKDKANGLSNKASDYKRMIHITDKNEKYTNEDIHNLYGYHMTKATSDAFSEFKKNQRYFLLSRSSYVGLHRFAAIWMGDNQSWWEHMLVHIKMLISLNMCGFFYTGADVGGFGCNASPELAIRWQQLGAFTPLYRNHAAIGTRNQEPWAFDEKTMDITRDIINFRYAMSPYIYSEFMKATIELKPFIKPIFFIYEDDISKNIEDQFFFGDSIMVCPIYTPNQRGRFVYLPESKWLMWNLKKYDQTNLKIYQSGSYFIEAGIDEIPIFIKENSLTILTEPQNYTNEKPLLKLKVIGFVTDKASFTYFEDDGVSYDYKNGNYASLKIFVEKKETDYEIFFDVVESKDNKILIEEIDFEIYDEKNQIFIKKIGKNNFYKFSN